jgi:hypothetical protein
MLVFRTIPQVVDHILNCRYGRLYFVDGQFQNDPKPAPYPVINTGPIRHILDHTVGHLYNLDSTPHTVEILQLYESQVREYDSKLKRRIPIRIESNHIAIRLDRAPLNEANSNEITIGGWTVNSYEALLRDACSIRNHPPIWQFMAVIYDPCQLLQCATGSRLNSNVNWRNFRFPPITAIYEHHSDYQSLLKNVEIAPGFIGCNHFGGYCPNRGFEYTLNILQNSVRRGVRHPALEFKRLSQPIGILTWQQLSQFIESRHEYRASTTCCCACGSLLYGSIYAVFNDATAPTDVRLFCPFCIHSNPDKYAPALSGIATVQHPTTLDQVFRQLRASPLYAEYLPTLTILHNLILSNSSNPLQHLSSNYRIISNYPSDLHILPKHKKPGYWIISFHTVQYYLLTELTYLALNSDPHLKDSTIVVMPRII